MWLEDDTCLQTIKHSWEKQVEDEGDMSFKWFLKSIRLKEDLRKWNKVQFGDIFVKVKEAKENLLNA